MFLSRFEGSETDCEVLKSISLVDTPGILGITVNKIRKLFRSVKHLTIEHTSYFGLFCFYDASRKTGSEEI